MNTGSGCVSKPCPKTAPRLTVKITGKLTGNLDFHGLTGKYAGISTGFDQYPAIHRN
jgi:hypothetical protein